MTVEQKFKKATKIEGILIIIGLLGFICSLVFTMLHLGFRNQYTNGREWQFLSSQQLWLINSVLGMLGGIFLNYKKPFIFGISGLATSTGITGFSMLYLSWREEVAIVESIFMLGIGIIPGVLMYKFLNGMIRSNSNH